MPRASRQRIFPFYRLARAIGHPGIDPRSWMAIARVDDDEDAIRFEPPMGWLVDVTFTTGALAQVGPVPCRVAPDFAGAGATRSTPIDRDCEVLVAVPSGDPNDSPSIVGQLHNGGGCPVPESVAGQPLTEELARSTHLLRSPHGALEEYDGAREVVARAGHTLRTDLAMLLEALTTAELRGLLKATLAGGEVKITGQSVSIVPGAPPGPAPPVPPLLHLGAELAVDSVVKGDTRNVAEQLFLTALAAYVSATAGLPGMAGPAATMATAIGVFQAQLATTLSATVKTA